MEAQIHYELAGVHARFKIPGDFVRRVDKAAQSDSTIRVVAEDLIIPGDILLVEDNFIIALAAVLGRRR